MTRKKRKKGRNKGSKKRTRKRGSKRHPSSPSWPSAKKPRRSFRRNMTLSRQSERRLKKIEKERYRQTSRQRHAPTGQSFLTTRDGRRPKAQAPRKERGRTRRI